MRVLSPCTVQLPDRRCAASRAARCASPWSRLGILAAGCSSPCYAAFQDTPWPMPYRLSSGDKVRCWSSARTPFEHSMRSMRAGGSRCRADRRGARSPAGRTTAAARRAPSKPRPLRNGDLREPQGLGRGRCSIGPSSCSARSTNAGQFPYVNGLTAQTAVVIAGGFTPRARAQLGRGSPGQLDGQAVTSVVPITYPVQRAAIPSRPSERWF